MRKKTHQPLPKRIQRLVLFVFLLAIAALTLVCSSDRLQKVSYPQKYSEYVTYYADKYQLDPLMLYSVIRTESGFSPTAQSGVDARGLMQITQETFYWIKSKIAPTEELVFEDLYDPETNIRFGSFYFARCMERYDNDLSTAAAAYHSGWGTVDRLLSDPQYSRDGKTLQVFPYNQMQRYVEKINKSYSAYQKVYPE